MSLRLIIEHSNHAQQVQEIRHAFGELSIGRGAECGWQLDDPDMYVSRKHCVISGGDGTWQATDASRGGLFVDGASQPLGPGNSVALTNGMRLRLGDVVLRVEIEAPRQAGAGSPPANAGQLNADDFFSRPVASVPEASRPQGLPLPFEQARTAAAAAPSSAALAPRARPPVMFDDPFSLDPLPSGGPRPGPQLTSPPVERPQPEKGVTSFADPFVDPFAAPSAAQQSVPARPVEAQGPASSADAGSADASADFSFDSFFGAAKPAAPSRPRAAEPDDWSLPPIAADLVPDATPVQKSDREKPLAERPFLAGPLDGSGPATSPIQPEPERERVRDSRQAGPLARMVAPMEPTPVPLPLPSPEPAVAAVKAPPIAARDSDPAAIDEGLEAFLRGLGLGLGPDPMAAKPGPAEMEAMGRRFRMMTEGLIQMLRTRAREKNDARLSQTIIGVANVNPIKFLAGTDEVVAALLTHRGPGYMKPDDAIAGALRDLAEHQMRNWIGLQAALRQMIDRFDPARIESELEETAGLRALLAGGRSARLWQVYTEQFREIAKAAEDQFLGEVGTDFRDAYLGRQQEGKT